MKTHYPSVICCGLLFAAVSAPAQGTFQNLGFESATIVHAPGYPSNQFLFAQAFPGWTGYVAGAQQTLTLYNELSMTTAEFSILDRRFINAGGVPGGLIEGNFTAVVVSGISGVDQPSDATLSQTGLVPVGTESLLFKSQFVPSSSSDSFAVTLGGQTLSLLPVGGGTNYTLYAADIHAFAGQTAQLAFTVVAPQYPLAADYLFLDSIQFSGQSVPEPGIFGLVGLGALALGWQTWARHRRR